MSKCSNSNTVSVEYFDNGHEIVVLCRLCQKKLESYRTIRYHFSVIHELDEEQFTRISKIGRLLE